MGKKTLLQKRFRKGKCDQQVGLVWFNSMPATKAISWQYDKWVKKGSNYLINKYFHPFIMTMTFEQNINSSVAGFKMAYEVNPCQKCSHKRDSWYSVVLEKVCTRTMHAALLLLTSWWDAYACSLSHKRVSAMQGWVVESKSHSAGNVNIEVFDGGFKLPLQKLFFFLIQLHACLGTVLHRTAVGNRKGFDSSPLSRISSFYCGTIS